MERYKKLQHLKAEIGRLFSEGLNEETIYNRLHAESLFADITRTQINLIYKQLHDENQFKVETKRKVAEYGRQFVEYGRQIAECGQQIVEFGQPIAKNEQQIAECIRRIAKAQDEKTALERVSKHQQKASNCLMHGPINKYINIRNIWQNRFSVGIVNGVGNVYTIEVIDTLQSMSKAFQIQKVGYFRKLYALQLPFVLLYERSTDDVTNHFRLLQLNLQSSTLEVVQEFDHSNGFHIDILVNLSNPSKFLLKRERREIYKCGLVDNQVQIGDQFYLFELNPYFGNASYFDNCLYKFEYAVDFGAGYGKLTQARILIYNLDQNLGQNEPRIDLHPTPEKLSCYDPENPNYCVCVRDYVFILVQFLFTGKHGIIFTDSRTRSWNIVEFVADWRIDAIQFCGGENLMISTRESKWNEQSNYEIFKLPMQKPDSLRNMAWLKVVNAFKKAKVKNPYAEARNYLPLTSAIQPFVFTEA